MSDEASNFHASGIWFQQHPNCVGTSKCLPEVLSAMNKRPKTGLIGQNALDFLDTLATFEKVVGTLREVSAVDWEKMLRKFRRMKFCVASLCTVSSLKRFI